MAQNTRTELKNKFKRGMYPTEDDFANVFDSYVHKEDMVELEKVVQTIGNKQKTLATIINESKQEAIAAAVQQAGKSEDLTAIRTRLKTAEDDIDAAEDNIAGHETRIKTLETSKSDYEEFKERVRAFWEDSDASDETINRWHEIESFLQGITDQKTLTGLLNDLKQEILNEIPEPQTTGNFIEYSTDLDAEADAPNGKIMQYWGQTNDKYQRGHFYERKAGDGGEPVKMLIGDIELRSATFNDGTDCGDITGTYHVKGILGKIGTEQKAVFFTAPAKVGDPVWIEGYGFTTVEEGDLGTINYLDGRLLWEREGDGTLLLFPGLDEGALSINNRYDYAFYVMQSVRTPKARYIATEALIVNKRQETVGGVAASSWQHLHIDNVIS